MCPQTVTTNNFTERLRATPDRPGVYLMRDSFGRVLYVGKASSLRHRLRSYFSNLSRLQPKIRSMVSKIHDFDFILTESDQEAVILECNLIKQHKPTFNARLKDDKSYPFIKIDLSEDFPLVYMTRSISDEGARYFGPFASARSVRKTLALLKKLFPYRSCTKKITGTDTRPCLDYYIHRCVGPCIGVVNKNQYMEVIDQVILFLEVAKRSFTSLKRQEIYLLVYVAGALVGLGCGLFWGIPDAARSTPAMIVHGIYLFHEATNSFISPLFILSTR